MDTVGDDDIDAILSDALNDMKQTPPAQQQRAAAAAPSTERDALPATDAAAATFAEMLTRFEGMLPQPSAPTGDAEADSRAFMQQLEQTMRMMQDNPDFARAMQEMAARVPPLDALDGADAAAAAAPTPAPAPAAGGSSRVAAAAARAGSAAASSGAASFRERVADTVSSINSATEEAKTMAPGEGVDAGNIESLLRMLGGAGAGSEGGGFEAMVQNMMGDLMSKDVLYEPMKDMSAQYPIYFEQHGAALSDADRARYQRQAELTRCIVAEFEGRNDGKAVVELMMQLQEQGNPPAEVLKALAPEGTEFRPDGLPNVPGIESLDNPNCSLM